MRKNNNLELLSLLISKGANIKNNNDNTLLHIPIMLNCVRDAKLLSASGANIEMIELILEKGADANIKDNAGRSALYFARIRKNLDIINLLLANGTNLNI
ncbi:ankyrin repeat domain-containing protein [Spiroplasma endosymbiont of Dilophus febrilis]|uniref:ankyrin repeat domain-containing protein n=2 Tax=unclassified Spiroplasma TaxID=2637901 RepID=UPI00313C74EA